MLINRSPILFVLVAIVAVLPAGALRAQEKQPHVVFLVGESNHSGSRETMPRLAKTLEQDHGFKVTYIDSRAGGLENRGAPQTQKNLKNLKVILEADLIVLFLRFREVPDEQFTLLHKYFESGGAAVAFRDSSHAFWNKKGWFPVYFGGHYKGHALNRGGTTTVINPSAQDHPILRGVPGKMHFASGGAYAAQPLSDSATPLLFGKTRGAPAEPVAWVNRYKQASRIFYTSVAAQKNFSHKAHQNMVLNAIYWALEKPVPAGGVLKLAPRKTSPSKSAAGKIPSPPKLTAPLGATVLFDGKNLSQWKHYDPSVAPLSIEIDRCGDSTPGGPVFKAARWKTIDGTAEATPGFGDLLTRQSFGNYRLHLDFLIPEEPDYVQGEFRGASGVYLSGRYEIQLLDSFSAKPSKTGCGAINGFKAPSKNACKKAGLWQSLEVTYKHAKGQPPEISVWLNGQLVQDEVHVPRRTIWGFIEPIKADTSETKSREFYTPPGKLSGPIRLQADSSRVRFANIWIRPLEKPPLSGKRWIDMDYGPFMAHTFLMGETKEIDEPADVRSQDTQTKFKTTDNKAYKGIRIPVGGDDDGDDSGGDDGGGEMVLFDTDLLRFAGGWIEGELDWQGALFDGTHRTNPSILGPPIFSNPMTPGWARSGSFKDPRKRPYGPLPHDWARFKGLYVHGNQVILTYTLGGTPVLELPSLEKSDQASGLVRTLNVGKSDVDLTLQICADASAKARLEDGLALLGKNNSTTITAAAWVGGSKAIRFDVSEGHSIRLHIPAASTPARLKILHWRGPAAQLPAFTRLVKLSDPPADLKKLTTGGPARWTKPVTTRGTLGKDDGPYALDTITVPMNNPYHAWMRLTGFDFFADGRRAAVCTSSGDVWIVSGIDRQLRRLEWKRIATGLFQPMGLKIKNDKIYVGCRDQITRLHDLNGDDEIDFYETFNNDHQVTEHFHEFAMDLQTDRQGNFYYAKCARLSLSALVPQHGALIKVSADGKTSQIICNGFRVANGVGIGPDGEIATSDQEGHWMPASRINLCKPGGFYGYMWSFHRGNKPAKYDPPLLWIPHSVDCSPGAVLWVDSKRWGPLAGQMISTSYCKGKLFLVLRENIGKVSQGALVELPPLFPTGIMRGRFNKRDGQLYLCGMSAWSTGRTIQGGFYRTRYTGKPLYLPKGLKVTAKGVAVTFTDALDKTEAQNVDNYFAEQWGYRWNATYGSLEYKVSNPKKRGHDDVEILKATLSKDGKTVFLQLAQVKPVMQMQISYGLKAADGTIIRSNIWTTIHKVGK